MDFNQTTRFGFWDYHRFPGGKVFEKNALGFEIAGVVYVLCLTFVQGKQEPS